MQRKTLHLHGLRRMIGLILHLMEGLFLMGILFVLICFLIGIKPYITLSGSMEPEIHTGSLCFVDTHVCYEQMEEGDVVAFETTAGSLVTHRILSITPEGLETKGDANETSDGISVTEQNFCGKTLFSIPYAGYGIAALQKPWNKVIICILIATVLLYQLAETAEQSGFKKHK